MPLPFPSKAFRRPRERTSRFLFAFGVDDLSLTTPTGHVITIDRNSECTVLDSLGRVTTLVQDQPAWAASYNAEQAVWETGLAIGSNRTNTCKHSEDFAGASWTASNAPSRTAAAWTIGDVVMDLIGDTSGATQAMYSQTVTLTGNTKKGVAFFVKRGRTAPAGGFRIRLRDTTASVVRLSATVTFLGSSTVPTVAMTNGILLEVLALEGRVYLIRLQSTAVTAANTNSLEVIPCDIGAETGDIYIGGMQVADEPWPEQYRKTTTTALVTQPDGVSTTFDAPAQDMTVYARFSKPLWAYDLTTSPAAGICILGDGGSRSFQIQYNAGGTTISAILLDAIGGPAVASATSQSTSQWEVAVQFRDLTHAPAVRIDAGAGFSAWTTTALVPFTAWVNNTLLLGTSTNLAGANLDAVLRRFLIAPGHVDLSVMRGVLV